LLVIVQNDFDGASTGKVPCAVLIRLLYKAMDYQTLRKITPVTSNLVRLYMGKSEKAGKEQGHYFL
jgi:hypothetical protein